VFNISYYNKGYFIETNYRTDSRAFSVWQGMLKRCYDAKHIRANAYKDVTIDARWHCFDYSLEDISDIDGWDESRFYAGELQLDKDIKGAKKYSTETCIWISKEVNNKYQPSHMTKFTATSPTGVRKTYLSQNECARDTQLDRNGIRRCLSGKQQSYKGWEFCY
jgi:hypothetical protein